MAAMTEVAIVALAEPTRWSVDAKLRVAPSTPRPDPLVRHLR